MVEKPVYVEKIIEEIVDVETGYDEAYTEHTATEEVTEHDDAELTNEIRMRKSELTDQ